MKSSIEDIIAKDSLGQLVVMKALCTAELVVLLFLLLVTQLKIKDLWTL